MSPPRHLMVVWPLALLLLLVIGCNGGLRPTLVEREAVTPQPPLQLELPPAPASVGPLAPAPPDLALQSSVDDALLAWATNRSVAYLDACATVQPEPGELCDSPTERDTVRLLGPTADEIWYIVTVEETDSLTLGTGYRVSQVDIAGR